MNNQQPPSNDLHFDSLTYQYDNRMVSGIRDFNININTSAPTCVMGATGSGKSTLAKLLLGQLKPQSGSIRNIEQLQIAEMPSRIQFENENENEQTESDQTQKSLINQLIAQGEEHGITDPLEHARTLLINLNIIHLHQRQVHQLSAGERQRFLLALAMCRPLNYLVLDEPFAHLDPLTKKTLCREFQEILKDYEIGSLWITHDIQIASLLNAPTLYLEAGELIDYRPFIEQIQSPANLGHMQFLGFENIFCVRRDTEQSGSIEQLDELEIPWPSDLDAKNSEQRDLAVSIPLEAFSSRPAGPTSLAIRVGRAELPEPTADQTVFGQNRSLGLKQVAEITSPGKLYIPKELDQGTSTLYLDPNKFIWSCSL